MTLKHEATYSQTSEGDERLVQSALATGQAPEQILELLESLGVESYVTVTGDLMVKSWVIAATDFASPPLVSELIGERDAPREADALEWVSQHLDELRGHHAGQWIAVADGRLACSSVDLSGLLERIKDSGIVHPFITRIPEGPIVWNTAFVI